MTSAGKSMESTKNTISFKNNTTSCRKSMTPCRRKTKKSEARLKTWKSKDLRFWKKKSKTFPRRTQTSNIKFSLWKRNWKTQSTNSTSSHVECTSSTKKNWLNDKTTCSSKSICSKPNAPKISPVSTTFMPIVKTCTPKRLKNSKK